MRHLLHSRLGRLSLLLGVTVALAAGLMFFVNTSAFQQSIATIVTNATRASLTGPLVFSHVTVRSPWAVDIKDVAITTSTGDSVIYVRRVSARIRLLPLLLGKVTLANVRLSGGRVVYDQGASPNLPGAFRNPDSASAPPKPGPAFSIDRIFLDSIDFIYRDTAANVVVLVPDICGTAALSATVQIPVHLSSAHGSIGLSDTAWSLDSVEVRGLVTDRFCDITSVVVRLSSGTRLTGQGHLPYEESGSWDVRLAADCDHAFLARLTPKDFPLIPGSSTALAARLTGPLARPAVHLEVEAQNPRLMNLSLQRVIASINRSADGQIDGSTEVTDSSVTLSVNVEGYAPRLFPGPGEVRYRAQGSMQTGHLPRIVRSLFPAVRIPESTGASARVTFMVADSSVTGAPDSAEVSATVNRVTVNGTSFPTPLTLSARYLGNVANARLDWADVAHMSADASFSGKGVSANATYTVDDLGIPLQALTGETATGVLRGTVHLNNALGPVYVNASVQGAGVTWRGLTVDTLFADLQSLEGKTEIIASHAHVAGILDSLAGRFGLPAAHGTIAAEISAQGSLPLPSVSIDGGVTRFAMSGVTFDSVSVRAGMRDSVVRIDTMRASKGTSALAGSGRLDLSARTARIDLSLQGGDTNRTHAGSLALAVAFDKDSIRAAHAVVSDLMIGALKPWLPGIPLGRGVGSLEASASGSLAHPSITFRSRIIGLNLSDSGASFTVRAAGSLHEDAADATCTLLTLTNQPLLTVDVRAMFSADGHWRVTRDAEHGPLLHVRASGTDLAQLSTLLPQGVVAGGMLDADLRVRFPERRIIVEGSATVDRGRFEYAPADIVADGLFLRLSPVAGGAAPQLRFEVTTDTASVAGERIESIRCAGNITSSCVSIDTLRIMYPQGYAAVNGTIPLFGKNPACSPRADIDITRFPLSLLNGWIEAGRFSRGTLSGRLSTTWGAGRPHLDGKLIADSIVFALVDISPAIGPVQATVGFSNNAITVDRLTGVWGKGTVAGQGVLSTDAQRGLAAEVSATVLSAPINYGDEVRMILDTARMRLSLGQGVPHLAGTIVLGPSSLRYEIPLVQNPVGAAALAASSPFDPTLDLVLRAPDNLRASVEVGRNILAPMGSMQTTVGGTVRVRGTLARPEFSGLLNTVGGSATYLDRQFAISQGTAQQPSSREINPFISVTATSTLTDLGEKIEVTLRITGELQDPKVSLTSNPQKPGPALISLLTLGSTSPGSSQAAGKLGDRATMLLSQSVSSYASNKAREIFGLEQMQVEDLDPRQFGRTQLTASKKLTSRLQLTYQGRVGDPREQKAILSYQLLPYLFLDGESDITGNAALDLKLKVER